jgi:hypothetical protein
MRWGPMALQRRVPIQYWICMYTQGLVTMSTVTCMAQAESYRKPHLLRAVL